MLEILQEIFTSENDEDNNNLRIFRRILDIEDLNIDTIPSIKYRDSLNDTKCSICLEDFIVDESIKQLRCEHIYHISCLEEWFNEKRICPLCRAHL